MTPIPIYELKDISLIKTIQSGLTSAGYPVAVDGIVGQQTTNAWIQFKQDNHQINPELVGDGSLTLLVKKGEDASKGLIKGLYYDLTPIRKVFLDLIAYCEGTDRVLNRNPEGYNILFGGGEFSDYSQHPRQIVNSGGYRSSAAGRYQIMDFTEDLILRALRFSPAKSFSPAFQDQRCLWLIHVKRNALNEVDKGDLWGFCQKCSWEWASIPPNRYGQPNFSYNQIQKIFKDLKRLHGV